MKLIDGYQVLGLLGRGGMSRVYKVRQDVGPVRALKLFAPRPELEALAGREALFSRFVDEAHNLAGLKHPNLVRVLAVHEADPAYYLMEHFCLGLADIIGEGPRLEDPSRALGLDQVIDYGRQSLSALQALHGAGLVHGDLKPANLMLGDGGVVRLGDLGLSHHRGESLGGPRNLVLGSPAYAAPEQESDPLNAGPQADIYSMGVSLFRLLTGVLPEAGGPAASALAPLADVAWDEFLGQAMAPDPANRFATAGRMAQALEALAQQWAQRREAVCAAWPELNAAPKHEAEANRPRGRGRLVKLSGARQALGLDGLMRPRVWAPRQLREAGPRVAQDLNTGLYWQRGCSPQPLTWEQAPAYARALNLRRLGGRADWRLPTAPELISLLGPPQGPDGFCGHPLLDPLAQRLWSADWATPRAAWYVSLDGGYVGRADRDCFFMARAVAG
ncbi:protein kinase domain-containing protein [Desulfoferula mesophila]|uniref:Serine/threonine protein kinase n=1 Tax=Desulfoferula mesophila TaxID=3058419 RepID=A0AAU9EQA1_9BACT|nr:serine/threonine protein kinase [Desulfoferula mesophilus]